jgi:tetratricopeptide (TPR) repeat protein
MRRLLPLAAICLLAALPPALASAQNAQGEQGAPAAPATLREGWAELVQRANAAYNEGKYDQASALYVQAIQLDPRGPDAYRNYARALFWSGDYPAALAYYDLYLVTFPQAPDVEQLRKERKLTSARTSEPWKLPAAQAAAYVALKADLVTARGYSRGGGGAWKTYQTLLATGYAHPELIGLQRELAQKLLDEHDALCASTAEAPIPALDLDGWALQRERLDAARRVADAEQAALIARRLLISQAAEQMLLGRYEQAAKQAAEAADANPDILFLDLMHVTALLHTNQVDQALSVLERTSSQLKRSNPALLPYASSLHLLILQRLGRHDDAAKLAATLLIQ